MFKRSQYQLLYNRLKEPRRFIQVVAGPRQVGKSTMVKQLIHDIPMQSLMVSADLIPPNDSGWIRQVWEQARQQMRLFSYDSFLLVIDEIHKLNNWSEAVKAEWDNDTFHDLNIKVVILGSSRLLLKNGLTESLTGRFELIEMPHWSYVEMHKAFGFSLPQYVYYGGYPGCASLIHDNQRWLSYMMDSIIEPAITKDVLMTKRIYKPELLRQLFQLGCSYSSELLSFNKIAGQLQDVGNTDTLSQYLRVLDESRLLSGIRKFAMDTARKYKSIPKYQVYNTALMSATFGLSFEEVFVNPLLWGRWVESAVGSYLMNQSWEKGFSVYYWRSDKHNFAEVDFILVKDKRVVAIEVKSGRRKDNAGIHLFSEAYHPIASLIIGGDVFPLDKFLSMDIERLFSL